MGLWRIERDGSYDPILVDISHARIQRQTHNMLESLRRIWELLRSEVVGRANKDANEADKVHTGADSQSRHSIDEFVATDETFFLQSNGVQVPCMSFITGGVLEVAMRARPDIYRSEKQVAGVASESSQPFGAWRIPIAAATSVMLYLKPGATTL